MSLWMWQKRREEEKQKRDRAVAEARDRSRFGSSTPSDIFESVSSFTPVDSSPSCDSPSCSDGGGGD